MQKRKIQRSYEQPTIASLKAHIKQQKVYSNQRRKKSNGKDPYQKILKKLLTINNYQQLKAQSLPYIKLASVDFLPQLIKSQYQKSFTPFRFQNYFGKLLIQDGLFIKHCCQTLLKSQLNKYVNQNLYKQIIFKKYVNIITKNKNQFNKYFKKQRIESIKKINNQNINPINKQLSSSKKKTIKRLQCSASISKNQNIGKSSKSAKAGKSKSGKSKSGKISSKKKKKNDDCDDRLIDQYYQRFGDQTQSQRQQRQKRYQDNYVKSSGQRKVKIKRVSQELKTNKSLRLLYQSLKNQRKQNLTNMKKDIQQIENSLKSFKRQSFFKVSLAPIQREIIHQYFPSIQIVISFSDCQTVDQLSTLGKYKNYQIILLRIKQKHHQGEIIYKQGIFIRRNHIEEDNNQQSRLQPNFSGSILIHNDIDNL